MKSKISIWDCRTAIGIAGGLPLAIRGDLFAEPGPDPVARWISETVLVTQLEVKLCLATIGRERPLEAPGNANRLRAGREPFGPY